MRKLGLLVCFVVILVVTLGIGCGFMVSRVINDLLNNKFDGNMPFLNKNYVVLLQNNMELRPSGGFMGSFGIVKFGKRGLEKIAIQDIYEPDGKLDGHVEPPYPIQEAFGQGWWKLRDANWDVDFAVAASASAWFFEQGGEPTIDGIVGINQLTVFQLIKLFGPFKLATYGETVSDKNFYSLAQKYAEVEKDKQGFLGSVGGRLLDELKVITISPMKPIKLIKLSKLILGELENGQVLVWMKDPVLQKEIEGRKWGGRLNYSEGDYLYIVESNLGANKANCCVKRMITHELNRQDEHVTVEWKNENEFADPKPPIFWGGDYRNYVRVVVPSSARVLGIRVLDKELRMATEEDFAIPNSQRQGLSEDMYMVEKRGELQIVGFWAVVPAGGAVKTEIFYTSPLTPLLQNERGNGYKLLVRRQPGIESFPYKLIVDRKIVVDAIIKKDQEFEIK